MEILLTVIGIAVFLILLIKSAGLIRSSLLSLSYRLRINYFVSGFILLSVASSLPELSVSITSASQDVPDLSLGNLLGATLFLLTLVIGTLAIKHKSIPFRTMFGRAELLASLGLILLMLVAVADGALSRIDGVVLIVAHLGLVLYLIQKTRSANHMSPKTITVSKRKFLMAVAKGAVGVVLLIISSNFLVSLLVDLADTLNFPEVVVGILLLGISTNLPELAVALTSNTRNENKIAAGNVVGSAVANVPILGVLALLSPHKIENFGSVIPVALALLLTCGVLGYFAWTDKRVVRWEGIVLVLIYFAMIAFQLFNIF